MASVFTYPHINISTKALQRRTPSVAESTATTLLAPFTCDRGPENELVAIDTFSDFQAIFGELDYSVPNQRQILNIGRWLAGGGRVLACRLTDINTNGGKAAKASSETYLYCHQTKSGTNTYNKTEQLDSEAEFISTCVVDTSVDGIEGLKVYSKSELNNIKLYRLVSEAKYSGTFYNNLTLNMEARANNKGYFDINVVSEKNGTKTVIEKFRNKTFTDFNAIEESSSYIGQLSLTKFDIATNKFYYLVKTDISGNMTKMYMNKENTTTGIRYVSDYTGDGTESATVKYINALKDTVKATLDAEYATQLPADMETTISNLNADSSDGSSCNYNYYTFTTVSNPAFEGGTNTYYYLDSDGKMKATQIAVDSVSEYFSRSEASLSLKLAIRYVIEESNGLTESEELDTPYTEAELADRTKIVYFLDDITLAYGSNTLGADVASDFIYGTESVGSDGKTVTTSKLVSSLTEILRQPLETPFDTLIDPGYPLIVKKNLIDLFAVGINDSITSKGVVYKTTFVRNDAFLYLTNCVIYGNGRRNRSQSDLYECSDDELSDLIKTYTNVMFQKQYKKVTDQYSADSGKEVFVPITYNLAYLVPYNDSHYGVQWPTAGLTRGIVGSTSEWISEVPTNLEKQANYDNMLNYVEKDSRGMYIMTQLTATTEDTALKFINNSRALLKIKKELTKLGRNYLHEFNDRITKNNLQNALNTCISNWISNRTLSYGVVSIQDYTDNDTLTNEELLILLDIKFTGTIEVISVEITVE